MEVLASNVAKRLDAQFVKWCEKYITHLNYMYSITLNGLPKNYHINFNEFCHWVYMHSIE